MDTRPRIAVDLDGVIYKWQDTVAYLAKVEFGVEIPLDVWLTQENSGLSKTQWNWLWTTGVKKRGLFRHGSLFKGAADGLRTLSQLGKLLVVTARPESAHNDTLAWLAFQRFPFSEIHMLGGDIPKWTIPADYYIDDGPEHIQGVLDNTDSVAMLWRRAWNIGSMFSVRNNHEWQLRGIDSWEDVCKELS